MSDLPYLFQKIQEARQATLEAMQAFADIYSDMDPSDYPDDDISHEQIMMVGEFANLADRMNNLLNAAERSKAFDVWKRENYI